MSFDIQTQQIQKGSRFLLQNAIEFHNDDLVEDILASSTSLSLFNFTSISWKSPIKENNYKEYRNNFLKVLDFHNDEISTFWPNPGPAWDGLATIKNESSYGILLVEAKAHVSETKSSLKSESQTNRILIDKSLSEARLFFNSNEKFDWTKDVYQIANRLAFLYFLNEQAKIPTWLIFINFTEDISNISEKRIQFVRHYQSQFEKLGIPYNSKLLDKIIILYLPSDRYTKKR